MEGLSEERGREAGVAGGVACVGVRSAQHAWAQPWPTALLGRLCLAKALKDWRLDEQVARQPAQQQTCG